MLFAMKIGCFAELISGTGNNPEALLARLQRPLWLEM